MPRLVFRSLHPPCFAHVGVVNLSPRASPQLFWLLQIGGWLLLIPIAISVTVLVFRDPGTIILIGVIRQFIGFGLTLGLWRLYRRWPAADFKLTRHAWQITLACIGAVLADVLLVALLHRLLELPPIPVFVERGAMFSRLALYVMWSALYFVIRQELETRETALRLARAEAANREAELQLLRAQVNPHFLLNALSTIIGEAERDPAAVIDTTHAVADYLRYSLGQRNHRARLGDEFDAMAHYLAVEAAHLRSHGLDWKIEAGDDARGALAPTALIQPLVENAIKYGLRSSPRPLRLRIRAEVREDMLQVSVENTGEWLQRQPGEEARDSTGIGLNNVRRRVVLLCGETADLEVATPPGAVRVDVRLPFVPAAAGA